MYYFNARWYDPVIGRFITEDPVRDGVNWFVYVKNNPLAYVDPTGLNPKDFSIVYNEYSTIVNVYDLDSVGAPIFNSIQSNTASNRTLQMLRRADLERAQEIAMNADMYQIGAGGWYPPAEFANQTYCNIALFGIMNSLGIDTSLYTNNPGNTTANDLSSGMANSIEFITLLGKRVQTGQIMEISGKAAQGLANAGYLVTATWINPEKGSGHVASIAPFDGRYDTSKGPMVANVGITNGVKSAYDAFGVGLDESGTADNLNEIRYYFDPTQLDSSVWRFNENLVTEIIP